MSDLQRYIRKFDEIVCKMENQMLCRANISDISIDFCECMIPCNEAVIRMCQNVLQYTENEPLKEVCNRLIENAKSQNCTLEEIKNSTYGFLNTVSDVNVYVCQYQNIVKRMICNMRNSGQRCVNLSFICQMIACQEGIICLCENCLQCCIDPRLRELCENIIETANEAIDDLKKICCDIRSR